MDFSFVDGVSYGSLIFSKVLMPREKFSSVHSWRNLISSGNSSIAPIISLEEAVASFSRMGLSVSLLETAGDDGAAVAVVSMFVDIFF